MKASEVELGRKVIPTGVTALDSLLGGGVEQGCITELFGVTGVGKSTLALQIIAAGQIKGIPCLFSDTEFQFTPQYASSLGVDCSLLDITRMRIGEDTFDAIEGWIGDNPGGLVVLDSIGGVLPREEAEKGSDDRVIGLQSRLMSAFCRRMIGLLAETSSTLIVVNHEVTNLSTGRIGSSGGHKLEHLKRYSIRLKPQFGKQSSRAADGTKRNKYIEAELKKEKSMEAAEGMKVSLLYEKGRGFVNEAAPVKRGRKSE